MPMSVCAHELSVGRLRCRGNIETKYDSFLPRNCRQTSAAAALRLRLVRRHPRNEQRPILDFICLLLRKRVHSSGKLPLCGVIKGTGSSPKLATTSPVECVCSALLTHPHICLVFIALQTHTRSCEAAVRAGSCS